MTENPWLYNGEPYEYDPESEVFGFVYEIENLKNGMKYIGRKYLTLSAYKQVKGKRKKIRKESDWKTYYGSSPNLAKDVEIYGKENFKRTIIQFFNSKGEGNYFETKAILDAGAILDGRYYNRWLSAKLQDSHVRRLLYNQPTKE